MTTALAALLLLAVLACPAHMLWQMRRGRSSSCAAARSPVDDVDQRQARLGEQIARMGAAQG